MDDEPFLFAFTAVVDSRGYLVGRADVGTKGYTPVLREGFFPTYHAAKARAEELNKLMGIPNDEADRIVTSTMR
jgi:hypothetical protein